MTDRRAYTILPGSLTMNGPIAEAGLWDKSQPTTLKFMKADLSDLDGFEPDQNLESYLSNLRNDLEAGKDVKAEFILIGGPSEPRREISPNANPIAVKAVRDALLKIRDRNKPS